MRKRIKANNQLLCSSNHGNLIQLFERAWLCPGPPTVTGLHESYTAVNYLPYNLSEVNINLLLDDYFRVDEQETLLMSIMDLYDLNISHTNCILLKEKDAVLSSIPCQQISN